MGTILELRRSTHVLSEHPRKGWFGADARKAMPDFESDFVRDSKKPNWGYRSWDDFFTRELALAPDRSPIPMTMW